MKKLRKQEKERKKKDRILTPMKMTKALQELGETYDRKAAILIYAAVFLIAMVLGFLFHLRPIFLAAAAVLYLLFVPRIMYNQKKRAYEMRRFQAVNAYMSQMAQSFTSTKNVLASLKETANTFPSGMMHDVLMDAVHCIESAFSDARESERKALSMIEQKFDCEKLRSLHDFLLKAEERGGDCAVEFQILERIRTVWESAVLDYHRTMVNTRNLVTLEYGLLIAVCIFVLGQFPDDLQIINLLAVQIVNAVQIMMFMVMFVHLDTRLNSSLLKDARIMTMERAEKVFAYINNFDPKKERRKNLPFAVLTVAAFGALFALQPGAPVLGAGILFFAVVINLHRISFYVTMASLKTEMKKAFPKWLFDVMLLMQNESVEVAIFKSVEKAPPVLRAELERIQGILVDHPGDADAYMSFLAGYRIPGVEPTMRKLYSLSVGTGGNGDVMNVIIDSNMTMLVDAEKKSISERGSMTTLYQFLPMLPVSVGGMVYCIALIVVIFQNVMSLI